MNIIIMCVLFLLSSCIGGKQNLLNNSGSVFDTSSKKLHHVNDNAITVDWAVDGDNDVEGINVSLKDSSWHLMTIKVTDIDRVVNPVKVGKIMSWFYYKPPVDAGQSVEIKDIDCEQSLFANVGDMCSFYFRFQYKSTTADSILFPVQFATDAPFKEFRVTAALDPKRPVALFRFAEYNEAKYYGADAVKNNKKQYKILVAKNGSSFPVNFLNIAAPKDNSSIQVVHRNNESNTDNYYRNNFECSIKNNPQSLQSNQLKNLDEECIIVYKANEKNVIATDSQNIVINTNVDNFFPRKSNQYVLTAHYVKPNIDPNQEIAGKYVSVTSGSAHLEGETLVADSDVNLYYHVKTKNPFDVIKVQNLLHAGSVADSNNHHVFNNGGTDMFYYDPYETSQLPVGRNILIFPVCPYPKRVAIMQIDRIGEFTPNGQQYSIQNNYWKVTAILDKNSLRISHVNPIQLYAWDLEGAQSWIGPWSRLLPNNTNISLFEGGGCGRPSYLTASIDPNNYKLWHLSGVTFYCLVCKLGCQSTLDLDLSNVNFNNYEVPKTPLHLGCGVNYFGNADQKFTLKGTNVELTFQGDYSAIPYHADGDFNTSYSLDWGNISPTYLYDHYNVDHIIHLQKGDKLYKSIYQFIQNDHGYDFDSFDSGK